ncbi:hypothetical protein TSUD_297800 [Trifolium subterraneum]|nr:hypothetical protein TSUD_297800 [Trifolium subterraneum]
MLKVLVDGFNFENQKNIFLKLEHVLGDFVVEFEQPRKQNSNSCVLSLQREPARASEGNLLKTWIRLKHGFKSSTFRLRVGGQRGSSWWREIAHIREGGEGEGRWFGEHVSRRVGDGSDTFFWTDPWVDEIPLCERFARLYDLAENKLCTMAEMCSLGWRVDEEAWELWRPLWVWEEEMLGECRSLLANLSLQVQSSD